VHIANLAGRLTIVVDERAVDVAQASDSRFGPEVQDVYERFDEFREWAASAALPAGRDFDHAELGAPAPQPRQLFAIGLNYREHAKESGLTAPPSPAVFTKFVTSITGPYSDVALPQGNVDWEVELVAVIGKRAFHVRELEAWSHVAGLTVGQDISERILQGVGPVPQFSLAKSFPGFTPMGPWLVTADEFDNPDDLELTCAIDGEQVQNGRTSELIFSVPALIAKLSAVLPLLPGDVIFTGTPAGVGMGRSPQRYLQAGQVLTSSIKGIGEIRQVLV
jgi:2-keto-4-pentenoate hydratase/2-oxohepta-3-ene-1,7-dioic acid hydratase in catechol pathway